MNKSESIKELATALSKFQGETNNAFKGKQGHGYAYADLASILEQSRPLLAANGLSVVQMPANAEAGHIAVETAILHSSGEWLEQVYAMPIPENKRNSGAQNMGSAITYARRYALAAALGIAQTDDDASLNEDIPTKADYYAAGDGDKNVIWGKLPVSVQTEIIKESESKQ